MLMKHMAACLLATALVAAPALAQTSTSPSGSTDRPTAAGSGSTATGSPAMQPGAAGSSSSGTGASSSTTGPSTMAPSNMAQGGMQGQFMTQLQPNQIMASKLIGTTVVGANNESVGDVNDVIVDRNGQTLGVVIGVGGFIGIGEKDVAVPFSALEFASGPPMSQTSSSTTATGNINSTGSTTSGQQTSAANRPATGAASADSDVPNRIMLRMTKAELQAAPTFQTRKNGASTTGSSTTGAGNPTTAPRQ
jgi:sporulation protein YlmC with PRC-barrel domain